MLELKNLRAELTQAVTNKNLNKIDELIVQFQNFNIAGNDWSKYLVQVFAMLTDHHIEAPTFVRRAPIFRIFRLATKIKSRQNTDVGNVKKILEYLLRIVEVMFSAVTAGRQIDKQMQKSFHSYLQKLLLSSMDFQHPKSSLPQQKIKILQKVYPVPNSPEKSVEFACSNLILWYQLFLQIKNTIEFDFISQKFAVDYLTRISINMKLTREPVVRWVFMYNMLQEGLKICNIYQQNPNTQSMCGKIVVLALTQIREYFSPFLQVDKINDHNQNIFVTTVRFNILSLCFVYLQSINNNQTWIKNIIEEIKKVANILLDRVVYEKKRLTSEDSSFGRLFKLQIQLQWIAHYTRGKQKNLKKIQNKEKDPDESFQISYLLADEQLFQKLCQDSDLVVNPTKVQKFEELLECTFESFRKKKNSKLSEIPQMPQLLLWSAGILDQNITNFFKSIFKICSPIESLKFFTCLLTQFNINNRTLILNTIDICLKVLNEYFQSPDLIKLEEDIENIKLAIFPLIMCQKQAKLYKCVYCGLFQLSFFCFRCEQACSQFIHSGKMPNLTNKWQQFIKMWQYFSSNEVNRVNQLLSARLIESVNLFFSY